MTKQTDLDLLDLAEAVARGDLRAADAEAQANGATDDLRDLTSAIGAVRAHAQVVRSLGEPQPATVAVGDVRLEPAVGAGSVRRRRTREHRTGRFGRPPALLVAAALLVGTAAVALGVGSGFPIPPGPTPRPAVMVATPIPTVPNPAPSVAVTSEDTPEPAPPGPGQAALFRDTQVVGVHLTSTGVGWATDFENVYRSTDRGATWTDVHAPFSSSLATTRFLDSDTAYIAAGPDSSAQPSGRIAVTHDGGATWLTTRFDDAAIADSGAIFAFESTDAGTAAFPTRDERGLNVYRTTDGGRTWMGPIASRLPDGMDGARGGFGPDTGVVWSSNAQLDGQPFDDRLVFSLDGGLTWQDRSFPIDGHAPAGVLKWVDAMRADGWGDVVLALDTECPQIGDCTAFYVSQDLGRTWRFAKAAPRGEVRLLSMTDWVLLAENPTGTLSTDDGGLSWRTVVGGSRIHFDATSIASASDIWAVHDCHRIAGAFYRGPDPYCDGHGVEELLLTTNDGAKTWRGVGQ